MCDVNHKCFYLGIDVHISLLTPGSQDNSVESCLFAFSIRRFALRLYFYTCLSTKSSSCQLSCHTWLYIHPPHPVSVTLYDFLVFQPHSLYFPHQFQPIYIPVSPSSSLSFPLKSVTYIQHSCLMNNGGETVTISISIRRISFDLCYSQLLYCLSSQLSSQVSSHFLSHVIFTPRFFSLLTVCILQQWFFGFAGHLWNQRMWLSQLIQVCIHRSEDLCLKGKWGALSVSMVV